MEVLGTEGATLPPQDEAKVLRALRLEALYFLAVMPHWMAVEDLISVGWLAYQRGWEKADHSRDAHQFAKIWARNAMKSEIRDWYGAGRRELGFSLVQLQEEHYDLTDEEYMTVDERRETEDFWIKMMKDMFGHLDHKQRRAMIYRFEYSFTYREIAEVMECCQSLAQSYVVTALAKLRHLMVTPRNARVNGDSRSSKSTTTPASRPTFPTPPLRRTLAGRVR